MTISSNILSRRHPGHKQLGVSLFDIVLGFAVILTFLGIIFVIYQQVIGATNVTQASTNYSTLTGKMKDFYRSSPTGYGPTAELDTVATNANLAPTSMVQAEGVLRSAWGTNVTMAQETLTQAGDSFTITYNEVPADDCAGFVNKVEGGAVVITVDGTSVKDITAANGQLNRTLLATSCNADADNPIPIVFTVR